jgi:hypothetical protein
MSAAKPTHLTFEPLARFAIPSSQITDATLIPDPVNLVAQFCQRWCTCEDIEIELRLGRFVWIPELLPANSDLLEAYKDDLQQDPSVLPPRYTHGSTETCLLTSLSDQHSLPCHFESGVDKADFQLVKEALNRAVVAHELLRFQHQRAVKGIGPEPVELGEDAVDLLLAAEASNGLPPAPVPDHAWQLRRTDERTHDKTFVNPETAATVRVTQALLPDGKVDPSTTAVYTIKTRLESINISCPAFKYDIRLSASTEVESPPVAMQGNPLSDRVKVRRKYLSPHRSVPLVFDLTEVASRSVRSDRKVRASFEVEAEVNDLTIFRRAHAVATPEELEFGDELVVSAPPNLLPMAALAASLLQHGRVLAAIASGILPPTADVSAQIAAIKAQRHKHIAAGTKRSREATKDELKAEQAAGRQCPPHAATAGVKGEQ